MGSIGEGARVVDAEVWVLPDALCNMLGLNWVCLSAKLEVTCLYEEPPHFPRLFLSTANSACLFLGLKDPQLTMESGVILDSSLVVVLRASSSDWRYDLDEGVAALRLSGVSALISGSSRMLSSMSLSRSSVELSRVETRVRVPGGEGVFTTSLGVLLSDLLVREFLR